MRKIKAVLVFIVLLLGAALLALYVNEKINEKVFLTEYTFSHKGIPEAFDGSKVLVISDLHEADFSKQIIDHIEDEDPDFVVITGDMVQLPDDSIDETLEIANAVTLMGIPIYAVSGNHDRQCGSYDEIIDKLWAADVYMLENGTTTLEKDGESICITGIKDPRHDVVTDEKLNVIRNNIKSQLPDEDMFTILLSHRADLYPDIKDTGVDLILSGHLHGGIARLPFVGGLIGKNGENSFFPEYEYGLVQEGSSAAMIVSGGCDKNPQKKRYFNPPEVLLITLKGE